MVFILFAAGAVLFTVLGGLLALRFTDHLHLILGFSAGALLGATFFDLLPEALELGAAYGMETIFGIVVFGFAAFMVLDRLVHVHVHEEDAGAHRGELSAASFSLHSFLDGTAIGIAFQVSAAVGAVVAFAVLAHKFSDGVNTVGVIMKNGGTRRKAVTWLTLASVAPLAGAASTLFFSIPGNFLSLILALFCGFFLYIGASDLLPESHHRHPTFWTTFATLLGFTALFVIGLVIGG